MRSKIPMSWEIAKGGRSVNVGSHGKIRMEPGLPSETIRACMLVASAAPDMLIALEDAVAGRAGWIERADTAIAKARGVEA